MIVRCAQWMLVVAVMLLAACAPKSALDRPLGGRPVMAITVDDIPEHGALPPGVTRADLSREMVAALKAARVPAYGFVNAGPAEREPGGMAAVELWAQTFPVASHTWSHPNLDDLTAEDYQADIARNEPLLERFAKGRDWRWFRYPFLSEGDDPAKRAAVRAFLAGRNYRIAAVTMDFSDWAYNDPYARCAAKGDKAAIAALEEDWLDAARYSVRASREMARSLYGGDIPYVLLTHLGGFDAHMFPRLLTLYKDMGFRFVTLEQAQNHPHYAQDNNPRLPAEPAGLEARMYAKGLKPPAERAPKVDLTTICT